MAFRLNYGLVLVFMAFAIMFIGLIDKSASHTAKALIVLSSFILMVFGAFVSREFFREKIEGQQVNDRQNQHYGSQFG